jgi:hypothetical protein
MHIHTYIHPYTHAHIPTYMYACIHIYTYKCINLDLKLIFLFLSFFKPDQFPSHNWNCIIQGSNCKRESNHVGMIHPITHLKRFEIRDSALHRIVPASGIVIIIHVHRSITTHIHIVRSVIPDRSICFDCMYIIRTYHRVDIHIVIPVATYAYHAWFTSIHMYVCMHAYASDGHVHQTNEHEESWAMTNYILKYTYL